MFRTELSIAPATDQLPRTARVLTMGSCFADSIGLRLAANKVETLVNPFGTVFQPLVLAKLLRAAAGEEVDWQQHVVEARGRWQSYDLHGSIGADSPVDLLQQIHELVRRTGDFLRSADVVLLTLGTAWAYRLRETGELVNNCHKQSADLFVRELLTPDEIINGLAETHAYLRRINPNLRFVLTVSPVRHLKDTLPLNSVSKSVLRVATHILSDLLPGVAYFPAYELLLDDLRDYRFYSADMLHPSEVAEEYIWDKFARTYFDVDFGRFRKEWASVRQSLGHRPLHASAPEHRLFLENTLAKLEQLSLRKVAVTDELSEVRAKLAALPMPALPQVEEFVQDDEERIDIGEGSISIEVEIAPQESVALPNSETRMPRLSPEEFRSQRAARSGRPERGRRDGRGKEQPQIPAENEQFQGAAAFADDQMDAQAALAPTQLGAAEHLLEQAATATPMAGSDGATGAEDGVKKKKRRSRGGAKRTARKNALRLAAGEILPGQEPTAPAEVELNAPLPDAQPESSNLRPEGKKSSVITKSVPVKRGGRNNELSRISRAELYAAPAEAPATTETPANIDAEAPIPTPVELPIAAPAIISEAPNAAPAKSRNSRNRGRKAPMQSGTAEDATTAAAASAELNPESRLGSIEQLSGTAEQIEPTAGNEAERNKHISQPNAAPEIAATPVVAPDTNEAASETAAAQAPPRRSNRPKRAVSGARAEKPAVDTPVVPVPDALDLRTQVAAGRMTGSSASLIEQIEPKKKAPAAKKPAAPKKAAAAKARPVKPTPEPVPTAPAAAVPAEAPVPAPKRKPAAKPKAAGPKPTAPKPAAPKPRAPRKPAKPA
ncbi:GSCFA domain-containing protein [Hymenobacter sp. BT770]|uniref:GSCFA domain-containing protein n=1 Tax=Hymenobacter sp. BT770 TaxID=2886942 RepID=UPI001D12C202|nr:GSCFA domain-containing protein [Hymenobacter sp. BT770]MCC3152657.1 GSCFA domain-containing protein [Hymenobacter sp. BT770]MDO3414730.1 GSCFA domain-containing protein [Hymenobacter sp. BT770]